MYDIIIVGAGIGGLNLCNLIKNLEDKKICIIEKADRIGGHIYTQKVIVNKLDILKKQSKKQSKKQIKLEAGGAVIYDYQKNMKHLIRKLSVETSNIPLNPDKYMKKMYMCRLNNKSLNIPILLDNKGINTEKNTYNFLKIIKNVFRYMSLKGDKYCRDFTLEQICLQILSLEDTRFIEFCYGYSSEFRICNSVVARKNIENELFNSKQILFFKNGYSEIINKLYQNVKNKIDTLLKCEIKEFNTKNGVIHVKTNNNTNLKCKKLVLAIPKNGLFNLSKSFSKTELELLNSVENTSLCRVFVQYDVSKKKNKWMKDIKFSTLENPIKQIIPINPSNGVFQISYTDWYYADYWGRLNKNECLKKIKEYLKNIFCDKQIDDPIWFRKYYWPDAIHFWKPGIDERKISSKITSIRKNVFICGESYSLNQGWCEGAIQTSIKVAQLINK